MPVKHEAGGYILHFHFWIMFLSNVTEYSILQLQESARGAPELRQVGHLTPVDILRILESVADHLADNSKVHIRPGAGSARALVQGELAGLLLIAMGEVVGIIHV